MRHVTYCNSRRYSDASRYASLVGGRNASGRVPSLSGAAVTPRVPGSESRASI